MHHNLVVDDNKMQQFKKDKMKFFGLRDRIKISLWDKSAFHGEDGKALIGVDEDCLGEKGKNLKRELERDFELGKNFMEEIERGGCVVWREGGEKRRWVIENSEFEDDVNFSQDIFCSGHLGVFEANLGSLGCFVTFF